jgi:hypothetical protein
VKNIFSARKRIRADNIKTNPNKEKLKLKLTFCLIQPKRIGERELMTNAMESIRPVDVERYLGYIKSKRAAKRFES